MLTIIFVNIISFVVFGMGFYISFNAMKRTGNRGYGLVALYFALVFITSFFRQLDRLESGDLPVMLTPVEKREKEKGEAKNTCPAAGQMEAEENTSTEKPPVDDANTEDAAGEESPLAKDKEEEEAADGLLSAIAPSQGVSLPFLPALLLYAVIMVSRKDPRRPEPLGEKEEARPEAKA